jgi:hypothetical protein
MGSTRARVWLSAVLGVAVIVGGPVLLILVIQSAYQTSPEPGKIDPGALDFPQLHGSAQPAAAARPATSPPATPSQGFRHLYECRKDGKVVYLSQPCGHEPVAPAAPAKAPTGTGQAAEAPELTLRQADECGQIQQEIDEINARMRQSYTPSESDWFRERLRKLNERGNQLNCGR